MIKQQKYVNLFILFLIIGAGGLMIVNLLTAVSQETPYATAHQQE